MLFSWFDFDCVASDSCAWSWSRCRSWCRGTRPTPSVHAIVLRRRCSKSGNAWWRHPVRSFFLSEASWISFSFIFKTASCVVFSFASLKRVSWFWRVCGTVNWPVSRGVWIERRDAAAAQQAAQAQGIANGRRRRHRRRQPRRSAGCAQQQKALARTQLHPRLPGSLALDPLQIKFKSPFNSPFNSPFESPFESPFK